MFSGIVEEVGKIESIAITGEGSRFSIAAKLVLPDLKLGDSISVSGTCLTVVELGANGFAVEAMIETLRRTKLGSLKEGGSVNLERALKVSDRLGGHIVSGHIDGLALVESIVSEGFAKKVTFSCPLGFAPYFIEKGSVTVDGVSLTVGQIHDGDVDFMFDVFLIPHTLAATTLGQLEVGTCVNIELDILAKYLARLAQSRLQLQEPDFDKIGGELSIAFLREHGYA